MLGLLEECLSIKHANKNIILCAADPDEEFYEILFHEYQAQSGCQEFWGKITNLSCSLGYMILLDQSEAGQYLGHTPYTLLTWQKSPMKPNHLTN